MTRFYAATRKQVYAAIDTERDYQDSKWNAATTPSAGQHEVGAFILFMEEYLSYARKEISTKADPEAAQEALKAIRKVIALGVSCMEQHGAPPR